MQTLQKAGGSLAGQLLRGGQAASRCQLAADITSACFKLWLAGCGLQLQQQLPQLLCGLLRKAS